MRIGRRSASALALRRPILICHLCGSLFLSSTINCVSYEDAFEALKNGDFSKAAPLLERAARETGYSSDIVNHAYTLALHHTGDKPRLADIAFRVADSLLEHD